MKITITNNIALNGGDAAILLGMIKALQHRFGNDTEFLVTGTYPEICEKMYPNIKWRTVIGREADTTSYNHIRFIGRIARYIKRYRYYLAAHLRRYNLSIYKLLLSKYNADTLNEYAMSDYIISSGGTYLIESYGITPQYLDYRISLILGKKLVQYTQSMGPFTNKQTQDRLRWVFNRCNTILLRDQKSADNILSLGLNNTAIVHVVPDAAFALGDIDRIMERKNDAMDKHGNVAVSVREWLYCADGNTMPKYLKSIAEASMRLIEMGYRVHFFSTCQGIEEYTDDNKVVKKILALIPDSYHSKINIYNTYLDLPQILELLREMDFIVATRLHMSILALISGTPVYPIAYEFKTIELYNSLGYSKVETLEDISPATLPNSIESFVNGFTYVRRNSVYAKVAQYISDTMNVVNYIR